MPEIFISYSYEVPLNKGGLRRELSRTIQGVVFFPGLLLRQAQYRFTTPQPPFRSTERSRRSLRGILYAIHRITRLNKMKIPIQCTYLYYYPSTSCFLCSFFKLHNCNALIRRGLRKVWSIEFFVICHLKLFRISIFVFRIWLRPKAALGLSVVNCCGKDAVVLFWHEIRTAVAIISIFVSPPSFLVRKHRGSIVPEWSRQSQGQFLLHRALQKHAGAF